MTLTFEIKPFEALSIHELYDVLRLRADVFVVEQDCVYPDIDGKDHKALHLLGKYEGTTVAYARIFKPGDYFGDASIGRVVIAAPFRDRKWGYPLMEAAIQGIEMYFGETRIAISAQAHLERFYAQTGFTAEGDTYLEDGIPHIRMVRG